MELSISSVLAGPFTYKAARAALMPHTVEKAGVYLIESLDCAVFYIGSTSNLARRFGEHQYDLNKGRHPKKELVRKHNSCGVVWKFFVAETIEEAVKYEQSLLNELKDVDGCLNVSSDAEKPWIRPDGNPHPLLGRTRPIEVVEKSANTRRGRYTGVSSPNYGKKHTEETKRKLSEIAKNRTISDETRLKLRRRKGAAKAIIINGVDYVSVREASDKLGIHPETIRHRLKSTNPEFVNWVFSGGVP